jgi:predicted phage tail protein
MKRLPVLSGAMGGKAGSGGQSATEAPDTLRSESFARVLDLMCEGEIEGFIDTKGTLLVDAVLLSQPTTTNGSIDNNAVLGFGGAGYSTVNSEGEMIYDGTIDLKILDPTGNGKDGKVQATIVKGSITAVNVVNGGSDYDTSVFATATIHSDTLNVTAGDTVTVGTHVYTFESSPTVSYQVKIGATYLDSLKNLVKSINGNDGRTPANDKASAEPASSTLNGVVVNALVAGSAGVGIAVSTTATHLSWNSSILTNANATVTVEFPSAIGKSIYLNDEPLQNEDMSYNFDSVTVDWRPGTQSQTPLQGFNSVEQVVPVGLQVSVASGSQSVIAESDTADVAIVGITLPNGLFKQNKTNGNITGSSVQYAVYVTYSATGFTGPEVLAFMDTIQGKSASKYTRTVSINLKPYQQPGLQGQQYTFRVVRITDDHTLISGNFAYTDIIEFDFVTMVTSQPLSYPNSALVGIQLDAQQFTSVPTRAYRIRGTKVQVPSNYFPQTRQYNRAASGITGSDGSYRIMPGGAVTDSGGNPITQEWDGTFYTAWTDNPAWCFYDLATNNRYGLGDYINSQFGTVDKWTLYTIGKYCDELVPDGFGSTEPRFTCNVYLQTEEDALKVLQDMASVFRGMVYWAQGTICSCQDALVPDDENITVYTNSDVKDGLFTYSSAARNTRYSVTNITYNDPNDFFRQKIEYVESAAAILAYGYKVTKATAFGCASRGQAARFGQWMLQTASITPGTVTFRTGFKAIYNRPFDVIRIFDVDRAGVSYAGRIISISDDRTQIITDVPQNNLVGGSYTFVVGIPTPYIAEGAATSETDLLSVRAPQLLRIAVLSVEVTSGQLEINLTEALPAAILPGAIWGIESDSVSAKTVRIITIDEVNPNEFEITALDYESGIYDLIDFGVAFDPPNISVLPSTIVGPPINLSLLDIEISGTNGVTHEIHASWEYPENTLFVTGFAVFIKGSETNYVLAGTTTSPSLDIPVEPGDTYTVQVFSIGLSGHYSNTCATASISIQEQPEPDFASIKGLERITGLELALQGDDQTFLGADATFEWRRNSGVNSYEFGSEPNGGDSGSMSPTFSDYIITILDPDVLPNPLTVPDANIIYKGSTTDNRFVFSYEMNLQAAQHRIAKPGVPYRSFVLRVEWKGTDNTISESEQIWVVNPAPDQLQLVDVGITGGSGKITITFPQSGDTDFNGYRVWISTHNGFTPGEVANSSTHVEAPIYEGKANPLTLNNLPAGTYYLRFAEIDVFSILATDCNISAQATVTVT